MCSILYFSEDVVFDLPHKKVISLWIYDVVKNENFEIKHLNFVFCSDAYLLKINNHYLNHNYFTDIITFDSSSISGVIEGDIFISIDRVFDNSFSFNKTFSNELHRVIIHGVLHLLGYSDGDEETKTHMRIKEDSYLSLLNF